MSVNRNIFYTILTQVPAMIFGITAGIFITRILGPEGKGVYAVFQADVDLLSFFLGFSISSGLVYFIASKKISPGKLAGMSLYFFFLICPICALFLFCVIKSGYQDFLIPKHFDSLFYILYLFFAFTLGMIYSILSSFMQGYKQFGSINRLSIINSILNLICFLALYFIVKTYQINVEVQHILFISLILVGILTILSFYLYRKNVTVPIEYSPSYKEDIKPFFKYIIVFHMGVFINFFNYRFDIWVLMHYSLNLKPVGYYSLAVSIAQTLWLISNPLAGVLMPHMSELGLAEKRERIAFYSRVNIVMLLAASAVLCIASYFLIPAVYGKDFKESVIPFLTLMIGLFFSSVSKPFGVFFASENKLSINVLSNTIGLILTVIFCLVLIPTHGIMGACIATDISYSAMCIFLVILFFIYSDKKYNCFVLEKRDFTELMKIRQK